MVVMLLAVVRSRSPVETVTAAQSTPLTTPYELDPGIGQATEVIFKAKSLMYGSGMSAAVRRKLQPTTTQ